MSWPTNRVTIDNDYRHPDMTQTLFDGGSHVLLLGTSRIGKTTLLKRIQEQEPDATYVDLSAFGKVETVLGRIKKAGDVLLLDEAQCLVTAQWSEEKIDALSDRLSKRGAQRLVLAGWPLLIREDMPPALKRLLENMHARVWMQPLTEQQSSRMIRCENSSRPHACSDEIVKAIYLATAGFPNLIAELCSFLTVQGNPLRNPNDGDLGDLIAHCSQHSDPFRSFYASLAPPLQRCLEEHQRGGAGALQSLRMYGVVAEDGVSLRGRLFERVWGKGGCWKPEKEEARAAGAQRPALLMRSSTQKPRWTFLTVGTEWFSAHGGLSTFNRELSMALAHAGHDVYCYVPSATQEERAHAVSNKVELLVADGSADDSMRLMLPPSPLPNVVPDVIIGHGRITGLPALALARHFPGSLRVHFLHMAPSQIEWFKATNGGQGAAEKAEEREQSELELARNANLVMAVGPRLQREFANALHPVKCSVETFIPGLPRGNSAGIPPGDMHVLLLGRAEDVPLKGLDIAARAMALVASRLTDSTRLRLVVRGAPVGKGDELREQLYGWAGTRSFEILPREYSSDKARIVEDIQRSSLLLMPSRSEGFGLVGLEAIAHGVPVLLSNESGLAEFIGERVPHEAPHHIVKTAQELELAADAWSRSIEFVLKDRDAAFARVERLRHGLMTVMSWDESVERLLELLPATKTVPEVA